MEYKIMSRAACEKYAIQHHNKTSVIISIRSSWDPVLPDLPKTDDNGIKDVLYLAFCDSDLDSCIKYRSTKGLMSEDDANEIVSFTKKWYGKVDEFIFHCDGGISRSAGVCAAVMRWFEGDDRPVFKMHSKHPNMFCYLKTLDAFRGISHKLISLQDCSYEEEEFLEKTNKKRLDS